MRAVAVVVAVIFTLGVVSLVGVTVLEPVGENVKDRPASDNINGTSTINTTYDVIFVYMPLFFLAGFGIWGIAWYMRRERVGRGGGGFR